MSGEGVVNALLIQSHLAVLALYASRIRPENIFLLWPLPIRIVLHGADECSAAAALYAHAKTDPEAMEIINEARHLIALEGRRAHAHPDVPLPHAP